MPTADPSSTRLIPVKYPCAVRRVTVRWDENEWKIVNQVRVDSMTLPAPYPLPEGQNNTGFWIEGRNSKGDVYQREIMPDPLLGMEQFEEGGEIKRLIHTPHTVEIEILVPDMPGVSELHLISNPAGKMDTSAKHNHPNRTVLKLSSGTGGKNPNSPGEQ